MRIHNRDKMANAKACCLARAQAPIQACLRPGVWVPGLRNLHRIWEKWQLADTSPGDALEDFVSAVESIADKQNLEVHKLDKERRFVQLFAFTLNCNWLDVVEVTFQQGKEPNTTEAQIVSFSSGVFPAYCPLGFLCNCLCFCAPFSGNGVNTARLEAIREAMKASITVEERSKSCNA